MGNLVLSLAGWRTSVGEELRLQRTGLLNGWRSPVFERTASSVANDNTLASFLVLEPVYWLAEWREISYRRLGRACSERAAKRVLRKRTKASTRGASESSHRATRGALRGSALRALRKPQQEGLRILW